MFRAVFAPSSHVCLQYISSIQKRHLAVGLDPDLVTCVRRDDAKSGDVQAKLSGLGEFSETEAQGEKLFARDRGGEVGEGFADIVNS
jgi:hypothetical protein